ncbi:MAG TPA: hypothetical protein VFW83_01985 [Bryobacteraceae bacterium]|nr:hypothetical protein [Bryobacteraceae bacterium]
MSKAIPVFGVIWVVCATVAAASVDRIPDPPAVTPHAIELRVKCSSPAHCQPAPARLSLCKVSVEQPRIVGWIAGQNISAAEVPSHLDLLTPQAADTSPPQRPV